MSPEMRSLLEGLLKRVVEERLGSRGRGYVWGRTSPWLQLDVFELPVMVADISRSVNVRMSIWLGLSGKGKPKEWVI